MIAVLPDNMLLYWQLVMVAGTLASVSTRMSRVVVMVVRCRRRLLLLNQVVVDHIVLVHGEIVRDAGH